MGEYFEDQEVTDDVKFVTLPKDEYEKMVEVMNKMYFKLLEYDKTYESADTGKLSKILDYFGA